MNTTRIDELKVQKAAIDKELSELKAQAKAELKAAFALPKKAKKPKQPDLPLVEKKPEPPPAKPAVAMKA
jgi:hypothetical protein